MLIIKNCNLINMAGIYEEKKDLVIEDGKSLISATMQSVSTMLDMSASMPAVTM